MTTIDLNIAKEKGDIEAIFAIAREYETEKDELESKIDELEEALDEQGKRFYHRLGDALDRLRIIPRLILLGFFVLLWQVVEYSMTPAAPEGFDVAAMIAAIAMPYSYFIAAYFQTGQKPLPTPKGKK